jgi:hypothetical protein
VKKLMIALGFSFVVACSGNEESENARSVSCDGFYIRRYHFVDPVTETCGIYSGNTGILERPCPPILALPAFRGVRHCFEKTEAKKEGACGKN